MKKMTNKQRCNNCIHKHVCKYCHDYDDLDGIDKCGDYKPKKKPKKIIKEILQVDDFMCVDCKHFQKCLEEYQMKYEDLNECSICGNFEKYSKD